MGSVYGKSSVLQPYTPKKRYVPKIIKHEQTLQMQVCKYLRVQYPHVIFRSDFASGLHLTPYQAKMHRGQQSGRAFPDIFIYHKAREFGGMALELKKEGTVIILKTGPRKGKISSNPHIQEQAAVINQLKHQGYYANFGVGIDDCIRQIDWYFGKINTKLF